MVIPPILAARLHGSNGPHDRPRDAVYPMQPFTGPVFRYPDGDGLWVNVQGKIVSIRLYGIDAPEWGQPYARQSWYFLQNLVWNKPVTCYPVSQCVHGRLVCDCYGLQPFSISLLMVFFGYAWYYRPYALEATHLRDAQRLARINRRGLWRAKNPIPPWLWRHNPDVRGSLSHG